MNGKANGRSLLKMAIRQHSRTRENVRCMSMLLMRSWSNGFLYDMLLRCRHVCVVRRVMWCDVRVKVCDVCECGWRVRKLRFKR